VRSPRPLRSLSPSCFPDSRHLLSYIVIILKVIESITNNREAQPGFDAVYMLMPTSANVDRIIRDFSGGRQQYAGAHLFFIDGPSTFSVLSVPFDPRRLIHGLFLRPRNKNRLARGAFPTTHIFARGTIPPQPAGPLCQLLGCVSDRRLRSLGSRSPLLV
jgi:hypothetical protein